MQYDELIIMQYDELTTIFETGTGKHKITKLKQKLQKEWKPHHCSSLTWI